MGIWIASSRAIRNSACEASYIMWCTDVRTVEQNAGSEALPMSDLGILPEERLLWQFPVMCLLVTFPTSLCEAYLLTFSKKRKEVKSIASEMAVERW